MTRRALLPLLALLASPAAFADTAALERTFLERAAISAADGKCNLFTEGERYALKSGYFQARDELLRANYDVGEINDLDNEVSTHARTLGCDHPSVAEVAATVRNSYRQFQMTTYIEYPAGHSTWGASRSEFDLWAVLQTDAASGAILGLRRGKKPDELLLAAAIPAKGRAPAAAQLFMRDAAKMREPWIGAVFGSKSTLSVAPRSVSRPEWAGKFEQEEDSVGDQYFVFYFSAAALARIEALDPRESVQLELTPSPMVKDATPTRVTFEIGDLLAAHYFCLIPKPTYAPPPGEVKVSAKPKGGH
jgi:hypothetical protein